MPVNLLKSSPFEPLLAEVRRSGVIARRAQPLPITPLLGTIRGTSSIVFQMLFRSPVVTFLLLLLLLLACPLPAAAAADDATGSRRLSIAVLDFGETDA